MGSKLIVKERSTSPPNFEARNIRLLTAKTTIPVPVITNEWSEGDRYFIVTERIPGEPLSSVWATMSTTERVRVAKQTADYLAQLRQLTSTRIQGVDGNPVYCAFLFSGGYGVPHGPISTDDELWDEMAQRLNGVPEKARQRLRERMPPATPYTFTHGDLTNVNIMVERGNLTGIIDWEASGYFPVWWELACAGIGLGEEDAEWKNLLRQYMAENDDNNNDKGAVQEFYRDFHALSRYPRLNARAEQLLCELDS